MPEIECDVCGAEMEELGGLLFSPPYETTNDVQKDHLCISCYNAIRKQAGMSEWNPTQKKG